jgi:Flp pilus assembly protein TadB
MRRLGYRALQLLGAYAAFILASIVAGFLGSAVGIWATVVWIVVLILGVIWLVRRRRERREATL